MSTEIKIRKSSACTLKGDKPDVFDFKCPRCMNIIMFFSYEKSPLVCRCGALLADFKTMTTSLHERVGWHFFYMTEG